MSTTCQLLKRLRDAGLTQFEIAKRSGIPQPTLSRWESGDVAKAADAALKLKALEEEVCGRPVAHGGHEVATHA